MPAREKQRSAYRCLDSTGNKLEDKHTMAKVDSTAFVRRCLQLIEQLTCVTSLRTQKQE